MMRSMKSDVNGQVHETMGIQLLAQVDYLKIFIEMPTINVYNTLNSAFLAIEATLVHRPTHVE